MSTPTQPPRNGRGAQAATILQECLETANKAWYGPSDVNRYVAEHELLQACKEHLAALLSRLPSTDEQYLSLESLGTQAQEIEKLRAALDASEGRQKEQNKALWELARRTAKNVIAYPCPNTTAYGMLEYYFPPCPTPVEIDAELARQGLEVDKE